MTTKITIYKWMCDTCSQLYDSEVDCLVHARATHTSDTTLVAGVRAFMRAHAHDRAHCASFVQQLMDVVANPQQPTRLSAADGAMRMSYDTPTITECDYGITPPPSVVRRRHAVAKPSPPDTKEIKQRKIEPVDSHMNYVEHTLFAYQCDVCERGFEDVRRLDYHKNTVHTARVWTCDPCQKSFKTRKHLAQHERTQTCMQHRSEMQMIEH